MEKTAAPANRHSADSKPGENTNNDINHKGIFFAAVLDMTWQMAVVVVVPIVGGFKLDQVAHTTPGLTILGFIIAMAGMFLVMRRAVNQADQRLEKRRNQQ